LNIICKYLGRIVQSLGYVRSEMLVRVEKRTIVSDLN